MTNRTILVKLLQLTHIRISHNLTPILLGHILILDLKILLWLQKVATRNATQVISRLRVAETNSFFSATMVVLDAKDDHVDEIGVAILALLGGGGIAEDAAGGEDGVDGVEDQARASESEVAGVVDGCEAVVLEEVVQPLHKLGGEEVYRLCTAGEDVVDDVVVASGGRDGLLGHIGGSVGNDSIVVGAEVEVLSCVVVDYGVEFNDSGVETVSNQGVGRSANSETNDQGGFLALVYSWDRCDGGFDKSDSFEQNEDGEDRLALSLAFGICFWGDEPFAT